MIVTTLPAACPHGQCRALLVLNRGEMDALRDFAYVVYTCSNGHTVQVGEPPRLRDTAPRPEATHPYRCPVCGIRGMGEEGQRYCSLRCSATGQARARRAKAPLTRGRPVEFSPRVPDIPYASKRRPFS